MKFYKMPKATIRSDDPAFVRNDIKFLLDHGIDVRRPNEKLIQLKLDEHTSYYPGKGTIYVDREPKARPQRGRAGLKAWIDEQRTLQAFVLNVDLQDD